MALIFINAVGGAQSKDSGILNLLGLISMARGDNGDAMRYWKQALTLHSGDISVRMNLGVMYLKNKLFAQASTQFERILKVAPNHQDARLHLAIIDASRGKNEEAIEVYNSILSQDKNNPLALFNLAVAEKNIGKYDDSIDNLKLLVKFSPSKSAQTDQAFALIDEVNALKTASGQKLNDDDLQALAAELSQKKLPKKDGVTRVQSSNADKNDGDKSAGVPKEDKDADQDIDALEKQLRSPAH